VFFVLIVTNFNIKRWKEANVIDWDITSYYGYLPAFFIHHDLKLDFIKGKEDEYKNKHQYWPETAPNGGKVIKTTMGMAIMYSPFFFVAHTVAKIKGYEIDGFSEPYEKYIHLSSIFYLLIGLIFLRKILLRFYDDWVVALVVLVTVLGTNLFFYSTTEAAMSHAYNFSLIAAFMYFSFSWHDNQKIRTSIYIGLIGGMIVLIRPINIIVFLVPLLYNVKNLKEFKSKITFFFKQWKHLFIIGILGFLILLPQLLYWKYITGNFFFNSYVGERFYFSNPHILEGLFSYRKGWLLYTPIMIFACIGFFMLYKKYRAVFWFCFVFTILNIYLLFSWWAWWYGGGFGMRAMIDSYSILAFPMAAFYQYLANKKRVLGTALFLTLGLVALNLFQTAQYRTGAIHWDGMTKDAYWASFGTLKIKEESYWELINSPDYDKAREGEDEYEFNPF
jgi:hypothetical protein